MPSAKQTIEVELIPTFEPWRQAILLENGGRASLLLAFASPCESSLASRAPPVFRSSDRIFFTPDIGHSTIEDILDETRVEHMESDFPRAAAQLQTLRQRLEALNNAHRFLRISGTEPGLATNGSLRGLIEAVLRPYCGGNRVLAATLDGDDTSIDSGQITSYALLIHELATNSLKYGALAADDGRLSIHICHAGQTMWLPWMEQAAVIPAQRGSHNGYGSTLLKLTVEKQLSGRISRRQGKGYLCPDHTHAVVVSSAAGHEQTGGAKFLLDLAGY